MIKLKSFNYVVSSLLVLAAGLVVLLASDAESPTWISISTGMIAAGLSSLAFSVIRFFDETEAKKMRDGLSDLANGLDDLNEAMSSLRRTSFLASSADNRRVFDRHPTDEVRADIANCRGTVGLDAIGLSLRPLYEEQIRALLTRRLRYDVKLVVQDPTLETFRWLCGQEARDASSMANDVLWVTEQVLNYRAERSTDQSRGEVSIYWFPGVASLTMTRVNDLWYVRPRFLDEANSPRTFFETYASEERKVFESMDGYFSRAVGMSRAPAFTDLERARTMWDSQGDS